MATSTVTSKGQITLPKAIRERLALAAGDVLECSVDHEGRIVLCPPAPGDLFGLLREYARESQLSVEEMKEVVRERAVRKVRQ